MIYKLTFLNYNWIWTVFICCIILLLIFIWKEWKTSGKKRFILKIILAFVALSSLAMIALKPAIPEEIKGQRMAILTNNYKAQHLDSLKKIYRKLKIIDYAEENLLPDFTTTTEGFVLGEGLKAYDLWTLKANKVNFLSEEVESGIIKLKYNQNPQVGDSLVVQGQIKSPELNHKLILEDASGLALDSVVLDAKAEENFSLSSLLKVSGKFAFGLVEKDTLGKVLYRESLPVKVEGKQALRILMLNAYPTFEIKYLKNFLAEVGHEVILRNQLSADKFKYEFFNTERMNLNRFTSSNLESFDLLISDAEALRGLGSSEKNVLNSSISQEGLGLLVLGEATDLTTATDFFDLKVQRASSTEVVLDQASETVVNTQPFQLQPEFGLEVVHSSNSTIISGYKRKGKGRVGSTLLVDLWQFQLQGKQEIYQQLWTELVENFSKKKFNTASWDKNKMLTYKDEPLELHLRTSVDDPLLIDNKGRNIAIQQDLYIPELWSATVYPKQEGWHSIRIEQDTTSGFDYFVHPPKAWSALTSYQTTQANHRFFQQDVKEDPEQVKEQVALNPLWFFGLFLMAMGSLWLEPKV